MRSTILIILSVLCFHFLVAQSPTIDSLQHMLNESIRNDERMEVYNELVRAFINVDPKQSQAYNDSLLRLSKRVGDEENVNEVIYNNAVLQRMSGNLREARVQGIKYRTFALERGNAKNITKINYQLGSIALFEDSYEESIKYFQEALDYVDKTEDPSRKAQILNGLGVLYGKLDQDEQSKLYNRQALEIAKAQGNWSLQGVICNSLGITLRDQDSLARSLAYFEQSLEAGKKANNIRLVGFQYRNIGTIHLLNEAYEKAERYLEESLEIRRQMGDDATMAGNLTDLAGVYIQTGRLKKAETYIDEAEEIFIAENTPTNLNTINWYRSEIEAAKGNTKAALDHLHDYYEISDSLKDVAVQENVNELNIKYYTQKKEAALKQKTFNNYLLTSGIISIGLLALFLLSRYRHKNQLQTEKIKSLKREKKLLAIDSMLNGQQEERKRIAQDLHDGLGSLLTSARLQIKRVQEEIDKLDDIDLVNSTEKLIENASQEVRRIAHDMMPGALVKLGFVEAIEDLVHQAEKTGELDIKTYFSSKDLDLNDKQSLTMYRIIQEALNNTLKHAKATNFNIQCVEDAGTFVFTIEDNGIGFQNVEVTGKGIDNIKSRVAYLEGDIEINSNSDGVSYEITIPK